MAQLTKIQCITDFHFCAIPSTLYLQFSALWILCYICPYDVLYTFTRDRKWPAHRVITAHTVIPCDIIEQSLEAWTRNHKPKKISDGIAKVHLTTIKQRKCSIGETSKEVIQDSSCRPKSKRFWFNLREWKIVAGCTCIHQNEKSHGLITS